MPRAAHVRCHAAQAVAAGIIEGCFEQARQAPRRSSVWHYFIGDITMTTTASGLQYEDTKVGTGAEAVKGQRVTVHYTGWLFNDGVQGAKFDSSKDRNDPFIFSLGAGMVIKGWDEGVAGMKVGGERDLIIPAALGYGSRGAGGVIPPNATLKFTVELLGVSG
jgi:FKBP-type peptidyl-prolyl cis-trans isomerase FkpA